MAAGPDALRGSGLKQKRALWKSCVRMAGSVCAGMSAKIQADIASYSITSSARARSVGGITQPPSSLSCLALK